MLDYKKVENYRQTFSGGGTIYNPYYIFNSYKILNNQHPNYKFLNYKRKHTNTILNDLKILGRDTNNNEKVFYNEDNYDVITLEYHLTQEQKNGFLHFFDFETGGQLKPFFLDLYEEEFILKSDYIYSSGTDNYIHIEYEGFDDLFNNKKEVFLSFYLLAYENNFEEIGGRRSVKVKSYVKNTDGTYLIKLQEEMIYNIYKNKIMKINLCKHVIFNSDTMEFKRIDYDNYTTRLSFKEVTSKENKDGII